MAPSGTGAAIGEAALALWRAAGHLLLPAAPVLLDRRQRRGKEDETRRAERLGAAALPRPEGDLVWVHAASIGEMNAAMPLINRLQEAGLGVLLTTVTITSAALAERRLSAGGIHQFAPLDLSPIVRRFLDHWRPQLALFVESELWPAVIHQLHRRDIPLALINGRMSDRSFRRWRRALPLARALLSRFDLCAVQTDTDLARFSALGADPVVVCGNLKFDAPAPDADPGAVAEIRARIGGRPTIVAASTHAGEEEALLVAHAGLSGHPLETDGAPLTIVVPRHPERGGEVAALVSAARLAGARRSRGGAIGPDTDVYVADTVGEMGLWLRVATLAFLGGSLVDRGGQNPVEAAMIGVPIVSGHLVRNFRDIYQQLEAANAIVMVQSPEALAPVFAGLLGNPAERQRLAREAAACVGRAAGAVDRTLETLRPLLPGRWEERGEDAESA